MRSTVIAIGILLASATAAHAQTNPCQASATGLVANPTRVYMTINDFNVVMDDGRPRTAIYDLGLFAQGVNPQTGTPLQTVSFTKAELTLVAGTTDCYTALIPQPTPANAVFAAVRGRRPASGSDPESITSWVSTNPFFLPPPALPPAAARVR